MEKQVAEFLRKAMKRGVLRIADPKTAAIHLLSLLESELLQRVLSGRNGLGEAGSGQGRRTARGRGIPVGVPARLGRSDH